MTDRVVFDVYGRFRVLADRSREWWDVYLVGADGERRRLDGIVVQSSAWIEGLRRALEAFYHEIAAPGDEILIADSR